MRKIALSNLSLLSTSLFRGPMETWSVAKAAGFDALKINPLRGWNVEKIIEAKIPVTAFEWPWRENFRETLIQTLKGEPRALLMDPILFGYASALEKSESYGYNFPPETVAVDLPEFQGCKCVSALETDADKRPLIQIHAAQRLVFDSWHMRGYDPGQALYAGFRHEQIVSIDVQTRDIEEWQSFLDGYNCLLTKQLEILRQTPETVSAALEINPLHLRIIAQERQRSQAQILFALQRTIRMALE